MKVWRVALGFAALLALSYVTPWTLKLSGLVPVAYVLIAGAPWRFSRA